MCVQGDARQSGRPGDKYTVIHMEAGLCQRPFLRTSGKPDTRGKPSAWIYLHIHPREAQRGPEKPEEAQEGPKWPREAQGGPGNRSMPEAIFVDIWEARHRGRPTTRIHTYMEAGLCRRASLCVQGKPDKAGGPVINTL